MWGNFKDYITTNPVSKVLRTSITGLAIAGAILLENYSPILTVVLTTVTIAASVADDLWQMHRKRSQLHSCERALRRRESPDPKGGLVRMTLGVLSVECLIIYVATSCTRSI